MLEQTSSSTGPAIHSLPYPRNPYFSGRQRVLDSLHRTLGVKHPERVQVISGDGGVGKTQLALEYAYRHLERYRLVWWLPAGDVNSLQSSFAALSEHLGVGGSGNPEELRDAVCRELEKRDDWLLIFDDAPDRESVRDYIPRTNGHILVTSRESKWDGVGKSFCLRVLERADAIDFLLKRASRPFEPSAHSLSQALGDLPLALEQAGALIAVSEITFTDYLRRFEDYWVELLQSGRPEGEYPDAVAMTWELACREVERLDVQAAALLKVLAFLAPAEIPLSLLRRMAPNLPQPLSDHFSSHVVLEGAIQRLTQFSLVNGDDRGIQVHRLVAALARDRLHEDERANWCENALSMMQKSFRFRSDDTSSWVECAEALPHGMAVAALAEAAAIDPATNAKLLNQMGEYLQHAGLLEAAKALCERALARTDEAHGPEDVRRSAIVNNLGRVLKRMGSVDKAREHFESALRLDQETYGDSHPHVAAVANNYGTVLHMAGDVKTALHQFEWALEICRSSYGPEHSKVATVMNNVAYALANQGDLDRSMEFFMQALSTAEASCGPNHPLVGTIRTNLGMVLRRKGQIDAARAEFERAVAIGHATLGPDHTDIARSLSQLGALAYEQKDLQTARDYFQRALDIDQRALGDNHPLISSRLNDLGCCLKALKDMEGATTCYERAAEITRANKPAMQDTTVMA